MKKLNYFFVLLFLFAALVSCDKRDLEMKVQATVSPTETGAIPIENVGNTSCEDVAIDKNMNFAFSSGKADYVNGEFVFESPSTGWPEGLTVTVTEGKYVQFDYYSDQYCVGAVIVKGGNASNVYTYSPGVKSDVGLVSPVNASGGPAGLSNLTFCFVECPEELVIAVKSYYSDGSRNLYCESAGSQVFVTTEWCGALGVNKYPSTSHFEMVWPALGLTIGKVEVENGDVKVTLNEGKTLICTYLYIGTMEDLQTNNLKTDGCPWYTNPNIWMQDVTPETDENGLSYMFFDL